MTWDPSTGTFTPGGSRGGALPGVTSANAASSAVTVQDLINLGLIDPGVVSGNATLYHPATTRFAASVATALEDAASSIELNSATLFKKMNGLAGMVIGSGGLAGYDSSGAATITIDPATGNVTLSGTITATAGAIGGWTVGTTSLSAVSGGNTTILSSGATSFSSGPTGAPTVTITQAGNIAITGGGTFNTTGYVKATGGTTGGLGTATFTALPASANVHGGDFNASGTGHALIAIATGSGDGVHVSTQSGTGYAATFVGNTTQTALLVNSGIGQLAINSQGTIQATAFSGPLTGNVTGNASGTAATVTGATQSAITSVGKLTALNVDVSTTANFKNGSNNNAVTIDATGNINAGCSLGTGVYYCQNTAGIGASITAANIGTKTLTFTGGILTGFA